MGVDGPASLRDTLRALIGQPGAITRAILDGQSTRYVGPGRLLFGFATAFFLLTALQLRGTQAPSPDVAAACAGSGGTSALEALLGAAQAPGAIASASPGAATALRIASDALCNPRQYTRAFGLAIPVALLLLMPLSAGLMQIAFRTQVPGFAGNWLYGLEVHAALFALLTSLALVSVTGSTLLGVLASLAGLVYASWNLVAGVQCAYRVSARVAAWKTTAVGVVYALALTVVSVLLVWAQLARR